MTIDNVMFDLISRVRVSKYFIDSIFLLPVRVLNLVSILSKPATSVEIYDLAFGCRMISLIS